MSSDRSSPYINDTASRVEKRLQLSAAPHRREDAPTHPLPSAHSWFYIVDPEATPRAGSDMLRGRGMVLGLSATAADAAMATRNGLDIVYHAELSETERRDMTARVDALRHREGRTPSY